MPFLEMKSKISKDSSREKRVLGVCKKPNTISKCSSCSECKIVVQLDDSTTATHTCHCGEQEHFGLDTSARVLETNEPVDMLVEDTFHSQAFASPYDGSRSAEKMEIACNYASNSEIIFSHVLDDELDSQTDPGNIVHWEMARWDADESGRKISFDNQACNVSDLFISDVLIASLPFNENGAGDVFTEISPLPRYIFPEPNVLLDVAEQCMLLPYLEDGSARTDGVKSDEDSRINVDNHDLFLGNIWTSSYNMGSEVHADAEQAEDFDPQLFIKNQPELSDVVLNYWPDLQPRDIQRRKAVTLVLDLDETLVHSSLEPCNDADFTFRVFFNMQENTVYVKRRPHLYRFLERVVELFHVVIFTASHSIYASQLLDILDPDGKFISQRFYRDSCILSDGIYTKDLTVLGLDLAKVAIVDNCPQVYRLQINNGIPIKSWYNDPTDDGLISLLPFLETLADANDVRPIIARRFGSELRLLLCLDFSYDLSRLCLGFAYI
ncbi:PREDICTED: uncharacterized protein LOC104827730 isoform X2 [Tarenaya hassleriana]|uniref:uncharacterized protein LOC104827730 isoform X2 n=1 Tax=Tarenaya hassleriana TaxID=28532 RepID=UPI00053C9730|nr:PREDICTED: uncharacterized protein LOC104827730 isoform X2 [Tarenaya hassleriana]XP_010559264.1 PREDICTED: uncharacterized protein LOC104827730 isoform X2 [Tarenaya hassleriana]